MSINNKIFNIRNFYKIATIIVTYNRKNLLLECINSLLNQKGMKAEFFNDIYIIDNNSSDGTIDSLQQYIKSKLIKYYNTGYNLGGAGGFAYGIDLIKNLDYDFVWIMDDDCEPKVDALLNFIINVDNLYPFGFLASKVLWKNNEINIMGSQRINIFKRLKSYDKDIIKVQFATFVSILVPIIVVREVGVPFKDFVIWGDDWDYTRRLSLKFPSYVISNSEVYHKTKNNVGCNIVSDDEERIERYYYFFRNDIYNAKKDGILGYIYIVLKNIKNLFLILLKSKNKIKRLKIMCKGIKDGILFQPLC